MDTTKQQGRLFGTDGIRGTPGVYPLTDGMIFKIGGSVAGLIAFQRKNTGRPLVIIGKDTRLSGSRIESILADAINYHGIDVLLAGILTTPALAYLTVLHSADTGIMISASHNKPTDNGIKFFNHQGWKLSSHEEDLMENVIRNGLTQTGNGRTHRIKGKSAPLKDAHGEYVKFLLSTVNGHRFKGMSVAVDCAHGGAVFFAKEVFKKLGASVYAIHDQPSGGQINAGGALNAFLLRELVLEKKADIGVALDGDGDRGILIDEQGKILDGDFILAISALALMRQNNLMRNTVVGTVMTNLGLKICIENAGGKLLCTDVGDKYVLETMRNNDLNLGGEQSGHIIFRDYHSSPDGLLTALQILKIMKESNSPLSRLASCMEKVPQVLVNVTVREKRPFDKLKAMNEKLSYFNERLKDKGRILLRYSGTEHLARVMVEGTDHSLVKEIADTLAKHIEKEIGTA